MMERDSRVTGRRKNESYFWELRLTPYVTFIIERFHAPRNGRRDFLITASKKLELIKPPPLPSLRKLRRYEFSGREIQFPARLRSEREFN